MKIIRKPVFVQLVSAALVFVFCYAAVSKYLNRSVFKFNLGEAPFINKHAQWLYLFVPILNMVIAICLIIPRMRKPGLYAALAALCGYTIFIAAVLIRGGSLPCTCNGVFYGMGWLSHLAFNIILISLTAAAIFFQNDLLQYIPSWPWWNRRSRKPVTE